jgi:YVTN family beta-propeller protein
VVIPTGPSGIAFDGQNLWVTNSGNNTLSEVSTDSLTVIKTVASGGLRPTGIAYDGTNVWVTHSNSNNIAKIRTRDGALLGTLPTGVDPVNPVYDGTNIWVANRTSNTVTKLRATDGLFAANIVPQFQRQHVWVVSTYVLVGLSYFSGVSYRASEQSGTGWGRRQNE